MLAASPTSALLVAYSTNALRFIDGRDGKPMTAVVEASAIDPCTREIAALHVEPTDAIVLAGAGCRRRRQPLPSAAALDTLIANVTDRLGTQPDAFDLERPVLFGARSLERPWPWNRQ